MASTNNNKPDNNSNNLDDDLSAINKQLDGPDLERAEDGDGEGDEENRESGESSKGGENVKVVVRCRPLIEPRERDCCVETREEDKSVVLANRQFQFDAVFGPESDNERVYMRSLRRLVEFTFEGFNCTVFLYGQTGTGKTYTHSSLTSSAFVHLFSLIQDSNTKTRFLIRASYYELYNEEIRDLLAPNSKKPLELRESKSRGVYVKDLTSYLVNNLSELEKLKRLGDKQKTTAATRMNEHSSRSHSIFSITIETVDIQPQSTGQHKTKRVGSATATSAAAAAAATGSAPPLPSKRTRRGKNSVSGSGRLEVAAAAVPPVRVGRLHLIDLAGSERQSKSGSTGARLKEASRINLSLTCLSLVIRALTDNGSSHVPYRNSKLTRLLSGSLGGNSKTLLIACISPARSNLDESLNTLRFASRTKRIKNKATINEDAKDALLRKYRRQIEELRLRLREQLDQSRKTRGDGQGGNYDNDNDDDCGGEEDVDEVEVDGAIERLVAAEGGGGGQQIGATQSGGGNNNGELLQQLRLLRGKIMAGGENLLEKAEMHERLLEASKQELDEKRREELKLKRRLELKQEFMDKMNATKGSLENQVAGLDEKLKRVLVLYKLTKEEQRDLASEHSQLKESLLQSIRATSKEIKYTDCIIDDFIPREYLDLINTYAQYDEESDEWQYLPKNNFHCCCLEIYAIRKEESIEMRAVVQRVMRGSVAAEGETVGSIGQGVAVLLGISRDDTHADSDYVIRKLLTLKIFSDEPNQRWQKSVKEANLELLIISQFTLCHTFKGTKPDFHLSMAGEQSGPFFNEFIERLKKEYASDKVQTGKFGSHMDIDLKLDGPVTLVIDSPAKKE